MSLGGHHSRDRDGTYRYYRSRARKEHHLLVPVPFSRLLSRRRMERT
jgi:hypothetical protein